MAIKERKQITGTEAQIKGYAGHNGVLAYATDTKHLHVLSGTAGTTTKIANVSDIPASVDISGKADTTYVNAELAKKANESHTHTVSQITDMPNVVLSVNNITPDNSGNVPLGLHAVATSGDYNDLTNKPSIPTNTSNWSVAPGTNGWARDKSTGFTIAWMHVDMDAYTTITYPRSFSSVYAIQRTIISTASGTAKNYEHSIGSYSTSSVTVGSTYWPSTIVVFGFS